MVSSDEFVLKLDINIDLGEIGDAKVRSRVEEVLEVNFSLDKEKEKEEFFEELKDMEGDIKDPVREALRSLTGNRDIEVLDIEKEDLESC